MPIKKRHIAHVLHRFDIGGLENGVVNLINQLPAENYHHTIVTLNGVNAKFAQRLTNTNVSFFDVGKKAGKDFAVYLRVYRLLKKLRPDVLHTRNLATLECQLPGWLCSVPYRIHGEHGWDIFDIGGTNKKYQWLRKPFRFMVHRYIALSTESIEYLQDKIGVAPRKIEHVCNGVDMSRFKAKQDISGAAPQGFFHEDAVIYGSVGRLAEVKNQGFLVDAFVDLVNHHPQQKKNLRLLLVGDGVLMPSLLQKVKLAGLQNNVWFAGSRSDVAALLQKMHVFVLPSLAEGISNTFLEAMASALPVIATNVGGNKDLMCPSHKATHLVPVGDVAALVNAMKLYILQPQKIDDDGQEVLAHCEKHFSLEVMVNKYHCLYQNANSGEV